MKRQFERFDQPVEANLRKAYRAPPLGQEPQDFQRLLSRLKDVFDSRQSDIQAQQGDACR